MIKSFRHKGLRLLWEQGNNSKLPADQVTRIEIMLEVIDSLTVVPQDFEVYKHWHPHKLTGEFKDFWSVKVNKNYRIIFRWDGQNAYDLDYIDYHYKINHYAKKRNEKYSSGRDIEGRSY